MQVDLRTPDLSQKAKYVKKYLCKPSKIPKFAKKNKKMQKMQPKSCTYQKKVVSLQRKNNNV